MAMEGRFSGWSLENRPFPMPHSVFKMRLQPFGPEADAGLVVANMVSGRKIMVYPDGRLAPSDGDLEPRVVSDGPDMNTAFDIEVVVLEPPAVPRAYAVSPVLDDRTRPRPEHLNGSLGKTYYRAHPEFERNNRFPRADLCLFAPQDSIWYWERNSIADIFSIGAVWLGAYVATRWGGLGGWPLPSAPHRPEDIIAETGPLDPCPCGSQKSYFVCCYMGHVRLASRYFRRLGIGPNDTISSRRDLCVGRPETRR